LIDSFLRETGTHGRQGAVADAEAPASGRVDVAGCLDHLYLRDGVRFRPAQLCRALHRKQTGVSECEFVPLCASPYPTRDGSAATLRSMLANNRRVRCPSAISNHRELGKIQPRVALNIGTQ